MSKISSMDPLDNLHRLNESEWKVLKGFCKGLDHDQIAEKYHFTSKTVRDYMARIYLKLYLDIHKPAMRRKILFQDICPAIQEISILPEQTSFDDEIIDIPPEVIKMVKDDEKALMRRGPDVVDITPVQNGYPRRPIPWGWLVSLILGIALLYVIFFRGGSGQQVVANPTNDSEIIKETVIVTATPAPDQLTQTSINEEKVVVVTPTLPPVTDTPEVPLVNPTGTIFFDDFQAGHDPAWEVQYGQLGMANGRYTVTASFQGYDKTEHYAVLREQNWGNMTITVNFPPFSGGFNACCYAAFGIIFRHQDNGDSIGLFIHPNRIGMEFGILHSNGQWDPYSGSLVTGDELGFDLRKQDNQIVIRVENNTYYVELNNREATSASIPGPEYGEIGLWFIPDSTDDAVDSYAGRIEDIRIESLP